MPKHIKRLHLKEHSKAWHQQRLKTIGGSSMGAVLGYSPYDTKLSMYYRMIGEPVTPFNGNRATKSGHLMEPIVSNLYKFWSGDYERCLDDMAKNKRHNRVRQDKATILNSKYPNNHANLDGIIYGDKRGKGFIEIKNTEKMIVRSYPKVIAFMYEGEVIEIDKPQYIAPQYWWQVQQYLMVLEYDFCDFITFLDGKDMEVMEVLPCKEAHEVIVQESQEFMERVRLAKEIKDTIGIDSYVDKRIEDFTEFQKEGVEMLLSIEPEMSMGDLKVIKEIMEPSEEYTFIKGTDELKEKAEQYLDIGARIKELSDKKDLLQAEMIRELGGRHEAIFDDGKIAYRKDSRGRNNFYVSKKLAQAS